MTGTSVPGGAPTAPRPSPSPEELAAIVAAIEVAWPRPVIVEERDPRPSPWRFSGRWWSRPQTVRRERPWISLND